MFKRKVKPVKTIRASHPLIEKARVFATYLDAGWTIPIIRKKIGLDPLIGLVPGVGDTVTLAMSLYLLWVAYQLNVPYRVYIWMAVNILIDFGVGTVPVLGDIADFFWKSNLKNLALLEDTFHLHGDRSHLRSNSFRPFGQTQVIDITPD